MPQSVSRSHLFAGVLAVAVFTAGSPAFAKKKPSTDSDTTTEPGLATSGKGADAAAQSFDQERPKPILEEEETGPAADEKGNVKFAGSRAGKGKITVNAPPKEKAKVYLEGRYFGIAPKTINGIPPGDYIIEVTYPNGKSVTKPVSVSGDEEALVELGGAAEVTAPVEKPMAPDVAAKRWRTAQIIGVSALVVAAAGLGFGIWEHSVQSDYDKTPADTAEHRAQLQSLANKGDKLALAANVCFVGAAVGLIAAGVIGYPAYKARRAEGRSGEATPDVPPPMSFLFAPGPGGASAGMIYHF